MNEGVLLRLHTLEALEVHYKQRWCTENLEFFHCLLMKLAS